MKFCFPAKTFLVGEYSALQGGSAILLLTKPLFMVSLINSPGLKGIHPDSPAGKWWLQQNSKFGLEWFDPYQGKGGLGASSAQFLGAFQASNFIKDKKYTQEEMLAAYNEVCSGSGTKPSGYDVIAQSFCDTVIASDENAVIVLEKNSVIASHENAVIANGVNSVIASHGNAVIVLEENSVIASPRRGRSNPAACFYINRNNKIYKAFSWPFSDLSFLLVHTNQKINTHQHLQNLSEKTDFASLSLLAEKSMAALQTINQSEFINCINDYHLLLQQLNLVAQHTLELITNLKKIKSILAIKGCGALGADVILIIVHKTAKDFTIDEIKKQNLTIIASETDLFTIPTLVS